jgi:hypothetical protein
MEFKLIYNQVLRLAVLLVLLRHIKTIIIFNAQRVIPLVMDAQVMQTIVILALPAILE